MIFLYVFFTLEYLFLYILFLLLPDNRIMDDVGTEKTVATTTATTTTINNTNASSSLQPPQLQPSHTPPTMNRAAAAGGDGVGTFSMRDLQSEQALIVLDTKKASERAEDIVETQKKILWWWNIVVKYVLAIVVIFAIRVAMRIKEAKFNYGAFIDSIDYHRKTADPSTGAPYYSGHSGLLTALAFDSSLMANLMFNNPLQPAAMYLAFSSEGGLSNMFNLKPNGPHFYEKIREEADLGTLDGNANPRDARQIACDAARKLFPKEWKESSCPGNPCYPQYGGSDQPMAYRMASSSFEMGSSAGIAGHMMTGGIGAGIGVAVGIGMGITSTLLDDEDHKKRCKYAQQFCKDVVGGC